MDSHHAPYRINVHLLASRQLKRTPRSTLSDRKAMEEARFGHIDHGLKASALKFISENERGQLGVPSLIL